MNIFKNLGSKPSSRQSMSYNGAGFNKGVRKFVKKTRRRMRVQAKFNRIFK